MISLQIIAYLLCLLGIAFFAGVEMGIISINRLRLQHLLRRQVPGAQTIRYFLTHPDVLLSTVLVGTNIANVMIAVLGASLGHTLGGTPGVIIAGIFTTLIVLIFGEYLPKAWFQASPAGRTLPVASLLRFFAYLFTPINWAIGLTLRGITSKQEKNVNDKLLVTREELLHLTGEGVTSGVLTPNESDMIHGVFDLTHKTCGTLMTPRDKIKSIPKNAGIPDILATARQTEFNRFPVYDEDQKSFVGVLNIFDILSDEHRDGKTAQDYMRPPQLVAAYLPADHLLPRMRLTRLPLFLVTDDRYEVVGLITLEDVLSEITGEE